MRRPLALFGAVYLAASLFGILMPQQVLGPAAAFLVCFCAAAVLCRRRVTACALISASAASALLVLLLTVKFGISPVLEHCGAEVNAEGVVTQITEYYGRKQAVVRLNMMNEDPMRFPVSVLVEDLPETREGDIVDLTLTPSPVEENEYRFSRYADGIFLQAEETQSCTVTGHSRSPVFVFRALRDHLAEGIRWLLHGDVGEIAAAMTLGDRSGLSKDVLSAFRKSGLSHVLVVSGLHLGMVSQMVHSLFRRRFSRRVSAAGACVATVLFMLLVGFTPSVMRAGAAMLLLYAGRMFRRQSDGFTSMGISALLLCLCNPYAAVDAGLLLSYSAASAVILVGQHERRQKIREMRTGTELSPAREWARKWMYRIAVPVMTGLFTLPVIASLGSGVSVWSVPANLIAVPLTGFVVATGLVAALCQAVLPFSAPAQAFSFLCGAGITIIGKTAQTATQLPGGYYHFSGAAETIPVLLAVLLYVLGTRMKIRRAVNAVCCALMVFAVFGVQFAVNRNVARFTVVGSAVSPAYVVSFRGEAVVLYRSVGAAEDAEEWLSEHSNPEVRMAVCLNAKAPDSELDQVRNILNADRCEDLSGRLAEEPIHDIMIIADEQKDGTYAMINIGGWIACIGFGTVDFTMLPHADLYVGGTAKPVNLDADAVLILRDGAEWTESVSCTVLERSGEPSAYVRLGRSAILKGVVER